MSLLPFHKGLKNYPQNEYKGRSMNCLFFSVMNKFNSQKVFKSCFFVFRIPPEVWLFSVQLFEKSKWCNSSRRFPGEAWHEVKKVLRPCCKSSFGVRSYFHQVRNWHTNLSLLCFSPVTLQRKLGTLKEFKIQPIIWL